MARRELEPSAPDRYSLAKLGLWPETGQWARRAPPGSGWTPGLRPPSTRELRLYRMDQAQLSYEQWIIRHMDALRETVKESEGARVPSVITQLAGPDFLVGVSLTRPEDFRDLHTLFEVVHKCQRHQEKVVQGYRPDYATLVAGHIYDSIRSGQAAPTEWVTVIRTIRNLNLVDPKIAEGAFWFLTNPEAALLGNTGGFFEDTALTLEGLLATGDDPRPRQVLNTLYQSANLFSALEKSDFQIVKPDVPYNHLLLIPVLQTITADYLEDNSKDPDGKERCAAKIIEAYCVRRCGFDRNALLEVCMSLEPITAELMLVLRRNGLLMATPQDYDFLDIKDNFEDHQRRLFEYLLSLERQGILTDPESEYYQLYGIPGNTWANRKLPPVSDRRPNLHPDTQVFYATGGFHWFHLRHRTMINQTALLVQKMTDGHGVVVVSPNRFDPNRTSLAPFKHRHAVATAALTGVLGTHLLVDGQGSDDWDVYQRIKASPDHFGRQFGTSPADLGRVCGFEKLTTDGYPLTNIPHIMPLNDKDLTRIQAALAAAEQTLTQLPDRSAVMLLACSDYRGTYVRSLVDIATDQHQSYEQRARAGAILSTMLHPRSLAQLGIIRLGEERPDFRKTLLPNGWFPDAVPT